MRLIAYLSVLCLAVAATSTTALARRSCKPSDWFPEIDAATAIAVSLREHLDRQIRLFDHLVADRAGHLPASELLRLSAFAPTHEATGSLTVDERRAFYQGIFSEIDANADGRVSREEFELFVIEGYEAWLTCRRFNR